MSLAQLLGNLAHATLDSMAGQQQQQITKRPKKKTGGCTPCAAQRQVDRARKRIQKGQLY